MRILTLIAGIFLLFTPLLNAQYVDQYLRSVEGTIIGFKKEFIMNCINNLGAPSESKVIQQVCECQFDLIDGRYPIKKIRSYSRKYKGNAFGKLLDEDTLLQQQLTACNSVSGLTLFSIPDYRKSFIDRCVLNLSTSSKVAVNDTLAQLFCSCAADILEKRKIPLEKLDELSDQSSFLYNEVAYKCGSPYLSPSDFARDWQLSDSLNVIGPSNIDSVPVISVMGMHKVKIRIGKETRIWMIDSGASDLLISDEFLKTLIRSGEILERDFIGEGRYNLADNRTLICKRYRIDSVYIGRFMLKNVIIASSKETIEFLLGKSVLNKFSQWILDNKNNLLILKK
jgi:hypothetical protein